MTDPCPIFAALFKEYIAAGKAAFRTADERDTPQAGERIRRARLAIAAHKRLRCCWYLNEASVGGAQPRLVDPREFDTPPLLAIAGMV